ncbi:MAG: hypothetical protein P8R42_08050 [Candidatus Binatia bacterium]|nr:hypothetical protein [Candidatus Binatia bacterium]
MSASNEMKPRAGSYLSASDILRNARALVLGGREKDLASEYDRLRQLPAEVVQEIRDAGIMRMHIPTI